jgi:hypothetical protein
MAAFNNFISDLQIIVALSDYDGVANWNNQGKASRVCSAAFRPSSGGAALRTEVRATSVVLPTGAQKKPGAMAGLEKAFCETD